MIRRNELPSNQNGFTLIEIMVALALSLILMAGVIQVYLSSKESFRIQNQLNEFQENQRIAIAFLQNSIRLAGNFSDIPQSSLPANPIAIVNAGTTNGNGTDSDTITVQFASPVDCLGQNTAAANGIATNSFSVINNQLVCTGVNNNPQPIISNVENMQILYGVDSVTTNDDVPIADEYLPASAALNFSRVVSVRISILFRSSEPIRTTGIQQTFNLLDAPPISNNNNDPIDLRIKRQVITTTIPIRNALQVPI